MGGKTGSKRAQTTQQGDRKHAEIVSGAPRAPLGKDKSSEAER